MGKINIKDLLKKENPRAKDIDIEIVGNAISIYLEATSNITTNGSIVLHPRTGAPIENPYLKIQSQQSSIICKFKNIKSNDALAQLKTNPI